MANKAMGMGYEDTSTGYVCVQYLPQEERHLQQRRKRMACHPRPAVPLTFLHSYKRLLLLTFSISYSGCRLEFMNIGNIHVMRESQAKLIKFLETTANDDRYDVASRQDSYLLTNSCGALQVLV